MLRLLNTCSLLFLMWMAFSCDNLKNEQISQAEADSLQTQLIILNDSVNQAWQTLTASDKVKEQSLKDLLEQITLLPDYNKPLHDSLAAEQAKLSQLRYNSPPALTSAAIDAYDAQSDKVKSGIYQLGNSTQGFASCALCGELKEKIETADNQTLFNRLNYDKQVQAYNAFIKEHTAELAAIKPAYENLAPLPLFQIAM